MIGEAVSKYLFGADADVPNPEHKHNDAQGGLFGAFDDMHLSPLPGHSKDSLPALDSTTSDDRFAHGGDTIIVKTSDQLRFLNSAGNSELFRSNPHVSEALRDLQLPDIYATLPGMTVTLLAFQALGVDWMLKQERGEHKGGILADEMGLGKTVQMIATIVSNRPETTKPTLVVCPVALLNQWNKELEQKTDIPLNCLVYHGRGKVKCAEELQKYDVVLTSYATLTSEYPEDDVDLAKRKRRDMKAGAAGKTAKEALRPRCTTNGPLLDAVWYRVILDEAQNIRNRNTRGSRAVTKLQATYRWCLTGTPIINGIADAYGPIRFLRIPDWCEWEYFKEKIVSPRDEKPEVATDRMQTIFRVYMMRRTKDSTLDGNRLIELPDKEIRLVELEFSTEEREVYRMVETRSQMTFNRYLREGNVLKNYSHVFAMLTRLRQICVHASLICEADKAFDQRKEELERARKLMGTTFVSKYKRKFLRMALERMKTERDSRVHASMAEEDMQCQLCPEIGQELVLTSCGHSFCRECILAYMNGRRQVKKPSADGGTNEQPCPVCGSLISEEKLFSHAAFEPSNQELDTASGGQSPSRSSSDYEVADENTSDSEFAGRETGSSVASEGDGAERKQQGKGKGKTVAVDTKDGLNASTNCATETGWKRMTASGTILDDVPLMPKFLPSTKMKYMMDTIIQWSQFHPGEKVLVISQWTSALQLVSNYLLEKEICHVRFQGNMTRKQRDEAIATFMNDDWTSIMLMSMKCGGVGLNLTRANRVVSLDPAWSEAVEAQAFDRVHRLGQTKDVLVERIVIKDTIEDRILELQRHKKAVADACLGEGAGKKLGKMSVKELAKLFGIDIQDGRT